MVVAQEPFALVVAAQIIALGGVIGALAVIYKYLGGRKVVAWFTKTRDVLRWVEKQEEERRLVERIRAVIAEDHTATNDAITQLADRLAEHLVEEQNLVGGLRLDFQRFVLRYDADQAEVWAGLSALGYERHPA